MYKLFRVSGYYTPEGEDYPFEDYLIFEGDDTDDLPKGYEDDDIFYYGINPSNVDKEQFNGIAKDFKSDINLYLFQEEIPEDTDQWLINIANTVDYIYVNLDQSKRIEWLTGWLLKFNKTFYLTTADHMSYNIINVKKVYDMTQVAEGVNYFEV